MIIEPIGVVNSILKWIAETDFAQANISYTTEYGWTFTLYRDAWSETETENISEVMEGDNGSE